MNKPRVFSYSKVLLWAVLLAIANVLSRWGLRTITGTEGWYRSGDIQDTAFFFIFLIVVLSFFRSAAIRQAALEEIHSDQD
jgi:hypothetical protein